MKTFIQAVITVLLLALGVFVGRHTGPKCPKLFPSRVDTLIVYDTLRDTVLVPVTRTVVRRDTVWLYVVSSPSADSLTVDSALVAVPIERKVYQTDDYRAEIEGFRPELVSMEVYRQTQFINRTQTASTPDTRRWGFGFQAGYGATIQNGRIVAVPTVGVGVQYSIFKW